jgi:RNA 3'-terminal phosphate cyclase (ATP)
MPLHNTNSGSYRSKPSTRNKKSHDHSATLQSPIPHRALKTTGIVSLDGRTLEGGGQLVRVALTLSALLSIPVHIHHIRGKRASRGQSGGLKESHLAALEFLQDACGAEVYGAEVGATEIVFLPGRETREEWRSCVDNSGVRVIELRNPGSVWLIFQAIYPFLLFRGQGGREPEGVKRPLKLMIRGGTNVSMSMSAEYVQQVFLPIMEKIGLPKTDIVINKRGWTHGRLEVGEVEMSVTPLGLGQKLEGFEIRETGAAGEKNMVQKITISVMASPTAMLEHLVAAAKERTQAHFPNVEEVEVLVQEDSGDPRRMYLLLVAHLRSGWKFGRDWLFDGKLKKSDERVIATQMAEKVVTDLHAEVDTGGSVDEFMQDQLVIFQALATGKSEVDAGVGREEGSEHTRTVRWVVEQMFGKEIFAESIVDGCGLQVLRNPWADTAQDTDALANPVRGMSLDG